MECSFSPLTGLEQQLPTPCYILEEGALLDKVSQTRRLLTRCSALCFAMKANPCLVGLLNTQMDRFEVCSPGEYEICHARHVDPSRIIVSGVNKTHQSIKRILTLSGGAGIYTIESPLHFDILEEEAKALGLHLSVLIRLSSGNQFGVDRDTFLEILEKVQASSWLELIGIHYFSGTQKKMKRIQKELTMLESFGLELKQKYDIPHLELEYGPGLAVAYFEGDRVSEPEEQLTELNDLLKELTAFDAVGIEMGRFLASSCGFFMTQVVDLKTTAGSRYAILDGGIHQLHYFGQMMGMKIPAIRQFPLRGTEETYILCGSLCTVNDVMVRDVLLHSLEIGDRLIFGTCGAYSMTEGSALFLSRELPGIYVHRTDGSLKCLREISQTCWINTETNEERKLHYGQTD